MNKHQLSSQSVSEALKVWIEKEKKEQYKKAIIETSEDELYIKDMKNIENEFQYCDFENTINLLNF